MSTKLAENATRRFAAHETFAPRFGWLRKAYQQVVTDVAAAQADARGEGGGTGDVDQSKPASAPPSRSDIFLRKTAPVELGVGKNMVNAIRFWSQAFGVTGEAPATAKSRAMHASATEAGTWLLAEDGADPWLEDPGSLWLLHWWLLRSSQETNRQRKSMAPAWWVAFNLLPSQRFTEDELVSLIDQQVMLAGWDQVTRSSIAKDVDCLTKMYAARRSAANSPGSVEDLLDCPFRELGLLEAVPDQPRRWRFVDVPRIAVPPAIAGYAALDFMASNNFTGQVTVPILAHEPGGVGRILRLTEPALTAALEQIAAEHPAIQVVDALGQRSLVIDGDPRAVADQILADYYRPTSTVSAPVHVGTVGATNAPAAPATERFPPEDGTTTNSRSIQGPKDAKSTPTPTASSAATASATTVRATPKPITERATSKATL